MAPPVKPPSKLRRIPVFVDDELEQLVNDLFSRLNFKASAPEVLGSLVLAARRLPVEVVRELMPAYVEREREELEATAHERRGEST